MAKSTFVYVTYIRTTPEKLWSALTDDTQFMKQYWFGSHCDSQWTAGSSWKLVSSDGGILDAGEIVEADPPRRLVIRWQHQSKPDLKAEGASSCTMELEPNGAAVKLSISHTIEREPSKLIGAVSGGWPKVLSNLKSLLETGSVVLREPYPAKARARHETLSVPAVRTRRRHRRPQERSGARLRSRTDRSGTRRSTQRRIPGAWRVADGQARPMCCAGCSGKVPTGTPSRSAWSPTRRIRRRCSATAHPTRPSSREASTTSIASPRC